MRYVLPLKEIYFNIIHLVHLHFRSYKKLCRGHVIFYLTCFIAAMARKSDRESALHYFDFQTEDAGISVGNIGKNEEKLTYCILHFSTTHL